MNGLGGVAALVSFLCLVSVNICKKCIKVMIGSSSSE